MSVKLAFLCGNGHVTVIQKGEDVNGRIPEFVQCSKLHCEMDAGYYNRHAMWDNVVATHEFYKPGVGNILSLDEQKYVDAGGLMFREIPGAVPGEAIDELKSAKEILKLAEFLVSKYPYLAGVGTPVDAAILLIENMVFDKALGVSEEEHFKLYIENLKKSLNG